MTGSGGDGDNRPSGAEAMVRMLQAYGVRHIFGLCGDTTLPFYDALFRLNHGVTHLLTRDERHAAYMADGYARVTGRIGVCEGPSGGGAPYVAPGVVEANDSAVALLSITSDIATTARGRFSLTELDQPALFAPLAKWTASLDDASQMPALVRRAFRAMTTGRPGAVHLAFPIDTQRAPVDADESWADDTYGAWPAEPAAPDPAAIAAAADALMSARRAVAICGGGVVSAGACEALEAVAARLDLPVATTVSGQGAIAETHPLSVGVVGSNGGVPATRAVVDEADLVVFIACRAGSVTTERWRSPRPGTRVVHLDCDPAVIGVNYPAEVAVVADARLALTALLEALDRRGPGGGHDGQARAAAAWAAKERRFRPLATIRERPIRPERIVATLQELLDDDAIICADPGTPCPYVSAYYRFPRAGRHFISNRAHGALGFALAAAIGAHVGRPEAKTVAVMGDGSFAMAAGELETAVRYRMPITFVVISNGAFGWIKAGQRAGFGGRYHNVDFGRTDHAAVAAAFGLKSWRVEDPEALRPALARALSAGGPTLVDIVTQPLEETAAPVSEWIA